MAQYKVSKPPRWMNRAFSSLITEQLYISTCIRRPNSRVCDHQSAAVGKYTDMLLTTALNKLWIRNMNGNIPDEGQRWRTARFLWLVKDISHTPRQQPLPNTVRLHYQLILTIQIFFWRDISNNILAVLPRMLSVHKMNMTDNYIAIHHCNGVRNSLLNIHSGKWNS